MCYKIFNIAIVATYFSEFSLQVIIKRFFYVNNNSIRQLLLIIDCWALTKLKLVVKWQNLLALMGTASFPAPIFGQERYSGQQDKAPKKYYKKYGVIQICTFIILLKISPLKVVFIKIQTPIL